MHRAQGKEAFHIGPRALHTAIKKNVWLLVFKKIPQYINKSWVGRTGWGEKTGAGVPAPPPNPNSEAQDRGNLQTFFGRGGAVGLGWVVGWGVLLQNADKSSPQQVQEIQPNLLQWSWWTRKQGDHHWHTSFLKQSYRFRLAIAASQCSGTSCDPCRHDVLTWRTTCDYSAEWDAHWRATTRHQISPQPEWTWAGAWGRLGQLNQRSSQWSLVLFGSVLIAAACSNTSRQDCGDSGNSGFKIFSWHQKLLIAGSLLIGRRRGPTEAEHISFRFQHKLKDVQGWSGWPNP